MLNLFQNVPTRTLKLRLARINFEIRRRLPVAVYAENVSREWVEEGLRLHNEGYLIVDELKRRDLARRAMLNPVILN